MMMGGAQRGGNVADDMGIFRTRVGIESHTARGAVKFVDDVLVDTGADTTWLPAPLLESMQIRREETTRLRLPDGRVIERDIGYAIVHAGGKMTSDEVVFALREDLLVLGARSIQGLNLRIDLVNKEFVPAGPLLV